MSPASVDFGDRPLFVLDFAPEAGGLPPLDGRGPIIVVSVDDVGGGEARARAVGGRAGGFEATPGARGAVAVVHPAWAARIGPTLAAVRAGVRTFHLVDVPGRSYVSNARGALATALRAATSRGLAVSLAGPAVERLLGHRLGRQPWPTEGARRRVLEAALAVRSPARRPTRSILWLGGRDPSPSIAALEHLLAPLRSAGVAVEALVDGADGLDPAIRRHLARLEVTVRVLARRPWGARAGRLRLPGIDPALAGDLEDHPDADRLVPLLHELLLAAPAGLALQAWGLDVGSATVAALAASLAGAHALLEVNDPAPEERAADLGLVLARSGAVKAFASSEARASSLAASCGLPPGRIVVVPPPLAPVDSLSPAERARARELLSLPAEAFVVACVGELDGESIAQVVDIVGPEGLALHVGPLDAEARLRAREVRCPVKLVGSPPDAREYLRVADAALCLSEWGAEAVSEAQAHGLPVVTSCRSPGNGALSFGPGDLVAARGLLERLRREPDLRAQCAARGRSHAEGSCAPEAFVRVALSTCGLD